jgi:RNA polymerase sigma factor (sigma-70 family)
MLVWAEMTDRALVQRAVSPSSPQERQQALQAIYDRHSADVLGLCGWWLSDPDAAMDAAQSTFETAIKDLVRAGKPTLRDPDKLGAWLHGIAKNQCRAVWRHRNREGEFPEEDLEDAEHEVTASRRRQAQVDRMLDSVAATFTERQQTIFTLVLRQGIRGQALAAELGVSEKDANDATYENQALVLDGFGAYVLARDGRAYCEGLARILDEAAWDGQTFTRVLRLRIQRHLDDCKICDDCTICNVQKKKLIRPYAPVLIPFLIAAALRDQVYEFIRRISTPAGSADGEDGPGAASASAVGAAAGAETPAVLDDYVSQNRSPGSSRHLVRHGRMKGASGPGNGRKGRISAKPLAAGAVVVVAAVVAMVVLLQSGSSGSSGVPMTATSALPPVTGDTYVRYLGGSDASAEISGQVNGATSGEIARLYARQFPFTAAPVPAGSLTLQPAGSTATYSFRVTPTLATRYQVELFRNSATAKPRATSMAMTIYVVAIPQRVGAPGCVGRPVCHLTETHDVFVPPSALRTEMSKSWYSYLGLNLSSSGTPPDPATLHLGAGNPVIGTPQPIAANEFSVTITYTFNIGSRAYHFHSTLCTKDTEAQDGIGLPGSHGCGNGSIPASTAYLG